MKTVPKALGEEDKAAYITKGLSCYCSQGRGNLPLHIGLVAVSHGCCGQLLWFAVTQWSVSVLNVSFVIFLCEKESSINATIIVFPVSPQTASGT